MGCCALRDKLDPNDQTFVTLNSLPTYENICTVYYDLNLPTISDRVLTHKKERMVLMIINLLRTNPKIFLTQLNYLKNKCEMRQKPKNLVYSVQDVDQAMQRLKAIGSVSALELSEELVDLCKE